MVVFCSNSRYFQVRETILVLMWKAYTLLYYRWHLKWQRTFENKHCKAINPIPLIKINLPSTAVCLQQKLNLHWHLKGSQNNHFCLLFSYILMSNSYFWLTFFLCVVLWMNVQGSLNTAVAFKLFQSLSCGGVTWVWDLEAMPKHDLGLLIFYLFTFPSSSLSPELLSEPLLKSWPR